MLYKIYSHLVVSAEDVWDLCEFWDPIWGIRSLIFEIFENYLLFYTNSARFNNFLKQWLFYRQALVLQRPDWSAAGSGQKLFEEAWYLKFSKIICYSTQILRCLTIFLTTNYFIVER